MAESFSGVNIEELELRQLALNMVYTFSYGGVLAIEDNKLRLYNDTARDRPILKIRASVGQAPEDQGIYIDIWKNGTSIFDETRGDYPQDGTNPRLYIFPGETTATRNPDNVIWETGQYLTISIDQVGLGYAGSDLTINVVVEE